MMTPNEVADMLARQALAIYETDQYKAQRPREAFRLWAAFNGAIERNGITSTKSFKGKSYARTIACLAVIPESRYVPR